VKVIIADCMHAVLFLTDWNVYDHQNASRSFSTHFNFWILYEVFEH